MFSLPRTSNLKTRRRSGTPNRRTNRYSSVASRRTGRRSAGGSSVRATGRSLEAAKELHQGSEAAHRQLGRACGAGQDALLGRSDVARLLLGIDFVDEGAELIACRPGVAARVGVGCRVQLDLEAALLAGVEALQGLHDGADPANRLGRAQDVNRGADRTGRPAVVVGDGQVGVEVTRLGVGVRGGEGGRAAGGNRGRRRAAVTELPRDRMAVEHTWVREGARKGQRFL